MSGRHRNADRNNDTYLTPVVSSRKNTQPESSLAGDIFNVTDRSRFTVPELATAAARAAGYKDEVRPLPLAEARTTMGDCADALALNQQLDSGQAVRLILGRLLH